MWWDNTKNVAALCDFLREHHGYTSSNEIIPVIERPWKWEDEWKGYLEQGGRSNDA